MSANVWQCALPPLYLVVSNLSVLFILWFGAKNVLGTGWRAWDIAAITTFLSCFVKMATTSSKAAKLFNAVQRAEVSWKRIKPLMKTPEELAPLQIPAGQTVEAQNLSFAYEGGENIFSGLSFAAQPGEIIGVTGPVACGKSTLGRTLIRMYEPTGGQIIFDGEDITKLEGAKLQPYHKRMQIIFQDPYSALDPHHNVEEIIREPMSLYTNASKSDIDEQIVELLKKVGMKADDMYKYAYEFSGGQRQRIGIARALAVKPEFLLCDEPISALDVSIQAQVVNMLEDLQEELGLTYLFVAHDLAMVKYISDRIGVMYLGHMVEQTTSDRLYENPLHPYTQALLSAIPIPDPDIEEERERVILQGELPSPINPPSGCVFRTRCPFAMDVCAEKKPAFAEQEPGHYVACHLYPGS